MGFFNKIDKNLLKKELDSRNKDTILIVDDEKYNLEAIATLLEPQFNVLTAISGEDAWELILGQNDPESIHLIISDQRMPGLSGVELLEKTIPKIPHAIRIILTGYTDVEDIIDSVNKGKIYKFIVKPFDPKEMRQTVIRAIELFQLGERNRKLLSDLQEKNKELEEGKQQLEQKVTERTKELQKSNEELLKREKELEQLNADKNKLFGIIAHDLKNPFNGILGFSQILSEDFDELSQDEIQKYARQLYPDATRLFKLLENLLLWATLQMQGMQWHPEKINLYKLSLENVQLLEGNAVKKKIEITNLVEEGSIAHADYAMINTVVRNLLSNAIKFTEQEGKIKICSQKKDEFWEISISDTGIGMEESELSKIFRVGEKHSTIGTGGEKGTGLGLTLCKELVEKNNGETRVVSKKGEGTTFTFSIPIQQKPSSIDQELLDEDEE